MSEIDRYIICVPSHANDFKNIEKVSYGGIVLYTDHLAALAEKDKEIHEKYKVELIAQNDQLDRYEEQIAALQAEIAYIRKFLWLNHGHKGVYGDDGEMQCNACLPNWNYREMDIETVVRVAVGSLLDQIVALTARIKELTEALERILGLCGGKNICPCGRPTGIPAIVSCIQTMLGGKK
jgi:hypothetical protein